ncbi:hypothetical protein F5B21DRAFT_487480 [Xylaria acuta]|nr:hypothetical protein F5B21DRAFT_487480 [Xylaria acuta]
MAPKTVNELREDRRLLRLANTRYGLYSRRNHEKPTTGLPTLLLLLRNAGNIPGGNRDRVLTQLKDLLGEDCGNLSLAGKDFVQGETRDLYANGRGEEFLNQVDAAILKAIERDNQNIPSILAKHLEYDYVKFYGGDSAVALDEIMNWAGRYLALRYRYYWQMYYWSPDRSRPMRNEPRRKEWGNSCNHLMHTGRLLEDCTAAASGRFRLESDPKDPRQLAGDEKRGRKEDFKALFEDAWDMTLENALRLDDWHAIALYDIYVHHVFYYHASPTLVHAWNASRRLKNAILIALKQREQYGGITLHIWELIQTRANAATQVVRNITTIPRPVHEGGTFTFNFDHWAFQHGNVLPQQNFPDIREPPALSRESQAQNVPPHMDGGGPGGHDDNENDGDYDNTRNTRNPRNNNNVPRGYGNPGTGFPPPSDENRPSSNWDMTSWATQISESVSLCDRCARVFNQRSCPNCTEGFDDAILSPRERWQAVLGSEVAVDAIQDRIQQVMQVLIQAEGWPMDMTRSRPREILRQMGPEFQIPVA